MKKICETEIWTNRRKYIDFTAGDSEYPTFYRHKIDLSAESETFFWISVDVPCSLKPYTCSSMTSKMLSFTGVTLMLVTVLLLFIIYIFALVAFALLRGNMDPLGEGSLYCQSLGQCVVSVLHTGVIGTIYEVCHQTVSVLEIRLTPNKGIRQLGRRFRIKSGGGGLAKERRNLWSFKLTRKKTNIHFKND